jgi:hypothetical protein
VVATVSGIERRKTRAGGEIQGIVGEATATGMVSRREKFGSGRPGGWNGRVITEEDRAVRDAGRGAGMTGAGAR